jgi:hypothetical protein
LVRGIEDTEANSLATRKQRELDDLQNEMAGREVGRQRRFLSADDERTPEGRERKSQAEALTRLQLLMSNPEYAKAYQDTMNALRDAERATETALHKAGVARERASENLNGVLNKAQRLPDGTRVFRDVKGNVWSEDGHRIDGDTAEQIEWKADAPDYETYLATKRDLEEAKRLEDEIRRYQTDVLGGTRDRLEDKDNPPSVEELDQIKREIAERMPRMVSSEIVDNQPVPPSAVAKLPIPAI